MARDVANRPATTDATWFEQMRTLARAKLGSANLISFEGDFGPTGGHGNASNPHAFDEVEVYGTSIFSKTSTLGTVGVFTATGGGGGPVVLQARGTGAGAVLGNPLVNMQSSRAFMAALVKTSSPGTVNTNTMIQFGLSDVSGSSKNMGLGLRGAVSTTNWTLWLPNGGAFTVAQSVQSTKTATNTSGSFVTAYLYMNGTNIYASVDGEAEIVAPWTQADHANAAGTWKIQNNPIAGAATDIIAFDAYCVHVVRSA